jgi:hypothetical protein
MPCQMLGHVRACLDMPCLCLAIFLTLRYFSPLHSFRFTDPTPETINYSTSKPTVMYRLIEYLKEFGGVKPVMVLHTVCASATSLAAYLEDEASAGRLGQLKREQVKLVSAATQYAPWQKAFLQNPNERVVDTMVLIVTPTLQAGHSIDVWIGMCCVCGHVMSHDMLCHVGAWTCPARHVMSRHVSCPGRSQAMPCHAWT